MEEAVAKARKEWREEQSCNNNQADIDDKIAAARREWIKNHNGELEKRLSNAIEEVRRIWDEEQQFKTKEVIYTALICSFSRRSTIYIFLDFLAHEYK